MGIDVAKATLDVAWSTDPVGALADHERRSGLGGAGRARARPSSRPSSCLEATGGYETGVASALAAAGLPVAIVNPRQVRDFARALGLLEKTDGIDADVLAKLRRGSARPRPLPDDLQADLQALVTRRRQLVDMLTAERNRVPLARGAVRKNVLAHIAWLEKQLGRTDRDLRTAIEASPVWRVRDQRCNRCPASARRPRPGCSPRCRNSARSLIAKSANSSASPR